MHLEEYIVFISVFPRKYGALEVFFGCDVEKYFSFFGAFLHWES